MQKEEETHYNLAHNLADLSDKSSSVCYETKAQPLRCVWFI